MLKKLKNLKGVKKLDSKELKTIKGGDKIGGPCLVQCLPNLYCEGTTCYPPDYHPL